MIFRPGSGETGVSSTRKLCPLLNGNDSPRRVKLSNATPLIGVFEGGGIGPQVIGGTLQVLASIEEVTGLRFELRRGGPIGDEAETLFGQPLTADAIQFCAEIFQRGGAILNGPGGGRYVYDLRRRFDLFCKFVPVQPWLELSRAGRIASEHLQNVDMLIVRDNIGGVYQGQSSERATLEGRRVEHSFGYTESEVQRIVAVAARAAAQR